MDPYWYWYFFYFLIFLVNSWAWTSWIEAFVIRSIWSYKQYSTRFDLVLGWVSLLNMITIPISIGISLLVYGAMIWLLPLGQYLYVYNLGTNFIRNPFGVFFGFFFIAVILEYILWRKCWRQTSSKNFQVRSWRTELSSKLRLLSWITIANGTSFLFGAITPLAGVITSLLGNLGLLLAFILIYLLFSRIFRVNEEWVSSNSQQLPHQIANAIQENKFSE